MNHRSALTASVTLLVVLAGCSSEKTSTPAEPEPGHTPTSATETTHTDPPLSPVTAGAAAVTYGGKDTGLATAVGCATDDGLTTIVIAADLKTTVVLTDEQPPIVKSVGIGEGADKPPALAYVQGVSGSAQASRDGLHYTITGTGMGADPATGAPVTATFQITANCT